MWKPGDPDRRKTPSTDAVRERRRIQQNRWVEREQDRRVKRLREEYHDSHARTVVAQPASPDPSAVDNTAGVRAG